MKNLMMLFLFVSGSFYAQSQTNDLVNMLTKEMGITEKQAEGGAGSLFKMSKENMSKEDFSKLSEVVPDMSGLLSAVPSLGGKKSLMGSLASQLTGMPAVVAAFEKLGLKEKDVKMMTPLVVNYIEKKGGKTLANLFSKSVTPKKEK
jgi:Protein of unknown function VcgC/VcgE (DUF2780)